MKKLLIITVFAGLFVGNAGAMDNMPESGFEWQVLAGFNASGLKGSGLDGKIGANIGFRTDYILPNAYGTYVSAGVDWSQKGAKKHFKALGYKNVVQAHYLNIPVHVGYRYNFSQKLGVYADLGPYFAVGFTGKNKVKNDNAAIDDTHTMTFGKSYNLDGSKKIRHIQRFDCGFGFRAGVEYNHQYSLNISYDWGFTDAWTADFRKDYALTNGANPQNLKNHNFTLTFGYRF